MPDPAVEVGWCGALEWAVCATARLGEERSGDGFLVEKIPAGVLVAVVDGLGHGDDAADAAELALASIRETAGQPLVHSMTACHGALRSSRGAVVTTVALDRDRARLRWLAVGNVDAVVVRSRATHAAVSRWSVPLRGGVVGDRLPALVESTVELEPGDTLVAATDGLSPAFADAVDPASDARSMAWELHRRYARTDDDALVLVARCGPLWSEPGARRPPPDDGVTSRPSR